MLPIAQQSESNAGPVSISSIFVLLFVNTHQHLVVATSRQPDLQVTALFAECSKTLQVSVVLQDEGPRDFAQSKSLPVEGFRVFGAMPFFGVIFGVIVGLSGVARLFIHSARRSRLRLGGLPRSRSSWAVTLSWGRNGATGSRGRVENGAASAFLVR